MDSTENVILDIIYMYEKFYFKLPLEEYFNAIFRDQITISSKDMRTVFNDFLKREGLLKK